MQATFVKKYGRKKKIYFPSWGSIVAQYINLLIKKATGKTLGKVLRLYFYDGKNDRQILNQIPISESTYYRWKNKFIDILYSFLISDGYVTKEEILISYEERISK